MAEITLHVIDDAVPEPMAYRVAALTLPFGDIDVSTDVTFHGMAPVGHSPLSDLLLARFGLDTTYSAFRLSPEGQEEPNFIHTDRDMGDWTGILYLNPKPPSEDGTTFWRHRETGTTLSTADTVDEFRAEWLDWRNRELWEPWLTVPAVFNRLILFPATYFHSRAIADNWGHDDAARLIQLAFGKGVLPCA